ncbi:hypothetical protein A1O1_09044 [Capronia coronata CBS 617.96]|uniref:DUF7053 domain-containing protein n=1 Tax=Capronia coronata CBS 617.96 TaxID=1182541 RepID=W9XEJ1_9EURO|nr:uncharacterized protein A1O1_09044 [Capronia coronata CBS 617.96]EXJ78643.1 hypothetical protein A1O1_09044 [Capronia coronata CBS 617.96]
MSFLQTTFKTGYITDLILPPVPTGKTSSDVFLAGHALALSMARSPETMSRLNPFVYSVQTMSAADPHAVDARAIAARFDVNVDNDKLDNTPSSATADTESDSESQFVHYEIKDKLPVALGYSADLTYHSAIRRTKEGIEALTDPGSGVLLHGRWMVKGVALDGDANKERTNRDDGTGDASASAGVLTLLETNTISCSVLVAWYIRASMDKSHRTAHQRFKELWTQRMNELGYPPA